MGAVVGIDLGTTNTVVATVREDHPIAIPDETGSTLIPSIVSFLPSGAVLVGNAARERRSVDPRNTIYSIKRLIGRTWGTAEVNEAIARFAFELREGPGRATFVVARGETYTLPEISAFVLRKAKSIAELELVESVDRAVITVPANFNDLQRAATKVAGRVAGLEILRVINEPTAAALAFGHASGNRECIAVYDFGGGTFDFTLLRLTDDVFEVLATAGNTYLGGDDIDSAIVQRIARHLHRDSGVDAKKDADTYERIRGAAEQLKIDLSSSTDARVRLADYELPNATGVEFSLTRVELEDLVRPIVERTFAVCRDALTTAGLGPKDIDHVLLVGGTTRVPYVQERVKGFFRKQPHGDIDPHEVVALGAARQAMALTQLRATASGIPIPPAPPAALPLTPSRALDEGSGISTQTQQEVRTTQTDDADVPALAQRNPGRDASAQVQRARFAAPEASSPIASAIVRPDIIPSDTRDAAVSAGQRGSPRKPLEPTAILGGSAAVIAAPANIGVDTTSMLAGGDSSQNLPAIKPTTKTLLGATFAHQAIQHPMEVRDDLWDAPDQGEPWGALDARDSEAASPASNHARESAAVHSANSVPDLPIVARPNANRLRATSPDLTAGRTSGVASPPQAELSPSNGHVALPALSTPAAEQRVRQLDVDSLENEPTVVRRSAREVSANLTTKGAQPEPKLDAIDLPIVSGAEKPEAPNRLSEAEIRARYGNLPLIVGGKRVGARESASKTYTPPLGTRTQVAAPPVPATTLNGPGAAAMPELELPIPTATIPDPGIARPVENTASVATPIQTSGLGVGPGTRLGPAQTREDLGNTRRLAPPSLTEKSTPFNRNLQAPVPLATDFRRSEPDDTPDDFVDPLTTEPTRPRFSVDVALAASAAREEPPKSHRPSSRPSARQNIDELELPIPDVPPRQSSPRFGGSDHDVRSPSDAQEPFMTAAATGSVVARQPDARTRPPIATAFMDDGDRLRDADPPIRATLPFGQPLAAPLAQKPPPSPFGLTAPQGKMGAGTLNLEMPPLVAPVPRTTSTSGRPVLLIDVTPLSLCVETVGGYVDVVVNRNTPVPCERTREYVTAQDNQQAVIIRVAQGESRLFQENVLLGEVQLSGIPAGVRGQSRIAVTFGIDADGLLHVRAMDVTSGKSAIADLRLAGISSAHEPALGSIRQVAKGLA